MSKHDDPTHSFGMRQLDAAPDALRHALRDYGSEAMSACAPSLRDARDGCIAVASAVHQYLMAQRLLRAPG